MTHHLCANKRKPAEAGNGGSGYAERRAMSLHSEKNSELVSSSGSVEQEPTTQDPRRSGDLNKESMF